MDTFKDKQIFDDMHMQGKTVWEVWKTPQVSAAAEQRQLNGVSHSVA